MTRTPDGKLKAGSERIVDRNAITSLLIEHGQLVFSGPQEFVEFTKSGKPTNC